MDLRNEVEPVCVQIVGTDPDTLAKAARFNVENGAQIIDINMGCPAKKVCKKAAGSALLENEPLVADILQTVAAAVDVPVTVKIRTGPSPENRNAVTIAKIAEQAGVAAITIHGRTRQCRFVGAVEYDTIAAAKAAVSIPVIANGDIDSPDKAVSVIQQTGVDAVMVGRAAQGQPWLLQQIADRLTIGRSGDLPSLERRGRDVQSHHLDILKFYGERLGVKLARKHLKWYLQYWPWELEATERRRLSTTEDAAEQLDLVAAFFGQPALDRAA
jgi:tRNA-dihydrouridine synthase B